jgi:quinol monooxygenase YgiN
MTFVQIIEFETEDIDGPRQVNEQWRQATEGKRTLRRGVLARDRNNPGKYIAMEFFDSYESAMENDKLPETQAASDQYRKVTNGHPVFHDLEVLTDES